MRNGEIHDYAWAPDGRWLAYVVMGANQQNGIWLYSVESRKSTLVSNPRSNDFNPRFDAAGKYLFFLSTRHENPTFSRSEFQHRHVEDDRHLRGDVAAWGGFAVCTALG